MINNRGFPMHEQRRPYDVAAVSSAYSLMAETDAEYRDFSSKVPDDLYGYPRLVGSTGPRGNDNSLRLFFLYLVNGYPVISKYLGRFTQFTQVLHEVVRKRIVIVNHQKHICPQTYLSLRTK